VGLWSGDATRTTPEGTQVTGTCVLLAREIARGRVIYAEFVLEITGEEPYEEGEFWWVDVRDKKVHLFSVNSQEKGTEHVGDWTDRASLVMENKDRWENIPDLSTFEFTWPSPGRMGVRRVDTVDGKRMPVSTFTMERQTVLIPA
jgi:hypothetical protein